ncbi:unnamed protein product [Caenorhabditis sp. 36 PRJEB53466]|nr:unnamed protein product [Caenorhabditis sp. 36 PRJEB53466]
MTALLTVVLDELIYPETPHHSFNIADEMNERNKVFNETPMPPESLLLRSANVVIDQVLQVKPYSRSKKWVMDFFVVEPLEFLTYGFFMNRIHTLYETLEKKLMKTVPRRFVVVTRRNKISIILNDQTINVLHPQGIEWATDWQHQLVRLAFLKNIDLIKVSYCDADFAFLTGRMNELLSTFTRVETPPGWVPENGQKTYRMFDTSAPPSNCKRTFDARPRPNLPPNFWGYVV